MLLRPCQGFGDLGWACVPRDYDKIRNPHEYLKVRCNNVEMRRAMIVGVHTNADEC